MYSKALTIHIARLQQQSGAAVRKEEQRKGSEPSFRASRVTDARAELAARKLKKQRDRLPASTRDRICLSPTALALPAVATSVATVRSPRQPRHSRTPTTIEQKRQAGLQDHLDPVANPARHPHHMAQTPPDARKHPSHGCSVLIARHDGKWMCDGELVEDTPMTQQMARRRMHAAISAFGGFEAPVESPEE